MDDVVKAQLQTAIAERIAVLEKNKFEERASSQRATELRAQHELKVEEFQQIRGRAHEAAELVNVLVQELQLMFIVSELWTTSHPHGANSWFTVSAAWGSSKSDILHCLANFSDRLVNVLEAPTRASRFGEDIVQKKLYSLRYDEDIQSRFENLLGEAARLVIANRTARNE